MQNKQDFISTIAELGGITKKDATATFDLVLAAIQKACKEDCGLSIVGVGKVEVKDVPAKSGEMKMKDGTSKAWETSETKTVKVKMSKTFVEECI